MPGPLRRTESIRALERVTLSVLPVVCLAGFLGYAYRHHILAFDARVGYLPFAKDVVHGVSPYPTANLPPFGIALFVPFAVLPGAQYLLTLLAVLTVPAILLVLDVRDWRCYGVVFLWAPVLSAVQTTNLTLPLVLAAALAWRWRDRMWPSGAAIGLSIAAKLISAPLLVWQVATRRVRAAVAAVATAVVTTLVLLVAVQVAEGRAGSFVGKASSVPGRSDTFSYSPMDFTYLHGVGRITGAAAAVLVVLILCGIAFRLGRRGDDARSFAAAAIAVILFAPNVWLHSLCFLLLPLGVLRPRLGWVWFVPVGLVVVGVGNTSALEWVWFWLLAAVVAVVVLLRPAVAADPAPGAAYANAPL